MKHTAHLVVFCCALATACSAQHSPPMMSEARPGPAKSKAKADAARPSGTDSSAAAPWKDGVPDPADTSAAGSAAPAHPAPDPDPDPANPSMAGAVEPAVPAFPEGTNAEYCAGHGPPKGIRPPSAPAASASSSTGGNCDNGIASLAFRHGFCACRSAVFSGGLTIDALDSSNGGRRVSASVGVNEQLVLSGGADIEGSLVVAGRDGISINSGSFHVNGNFETNSFLSTNGFNIELGRDAWVNGLISANGGMSVLGDLYQPPGSSHSRSVRIGGQRLERDFDVPMPCPCGENEQLDIKAIVEAGKAQTGAKPDAQLPSLEEGTQTLDCGRVAVGRTWLRGVTTLNVPGRTALFIDGDLAVTGGFRIDVGTTGELDVFVSGNLSFAGVGTIGSRERPAAVRFYVGGSSGITFSGSHDFAGNLYAPNATVTVSGAQELWGSLLVGSYVASGAQVMHYDSAILRSGGASETCDTPPPPPGDTPPPPGGCEIDLDCPSLQVCTAGHCNYLGPD